MKSIEDNKTGAKYKFNTLDQTIIHQSSFLRERKNFKISKLKNNIPLTIDIISKAISIAGVGVSIYFGFLSYNKTQIIKELEYKNSALKFSLDSVLTNNQNKTLKK